MTTRTDSPDGFMRLGAEYYLAGRFAFLQRCRISANLFHHSVELFLKYDLLTDVPEAARRKYGHDLDRLWADFKDRDTSRIALARFDKVVQASTIGSTFATAATERRRRPGRGSRRP